jgi:hypothetical protein
MVSFIGLVLWLLFIQGSGGDSGSDSVKFETLRGVKAPARDDMHNSLFYVADIPGKGMGLLASRDIKVRIFNPPVEDEFTIHLQQGELLIREMPLFVVPRESELH